MFDTTVACFVKFLLHNVFWTGLRVAVWTVDKLFEGY
jgi:hypothetical protein